MKQCTQFLLLFFMIVLLSSCSSVPRQNSSTEAETPVRIANDSLAYEIIIIDPGFNVYLASIARPEGFFSQEYMELRNRFWVTTWNQRAQNPQLFNENIYENIIDYDFNVDYGYEVNYKLFNYFLFAQRKYKMNLGGGFRQNQLR